MTTVTINVPCEDDRVEKRIGVVAMLRVGERKRRFVLIDGHNLTDFRSGRMVGSFADLKVQAHVADPYRRPLSDRAAAQMLLDRLVAQHGLQRVEGKLDYHPTLNKGAGL